MGTLQPPTARKLQAIYNTAGRSWANISCPFPTPLDLQVLCLNSHWANPRQIRAEIRGAVHLQQAASSLSTRLLVWSSGRRGELVPFADGVPTMSLPSGVSFLLVTPC